MHGADRETWTPEFLSTLERIRELVTTASLDAVVVVQLAYAINWHSNFSGGPTKDAAKTVIAAIPQTEKYQLTVALVDGWGHLLRERGENFREAQAEWRDEQLRIAREFVKKNIDTKEALDIFQERISVIQKVAGQINSSPGIFTRLLCEMVPKLAQGIGECVVADPQSSLCNVFDDALYGLTQSAPQAAISIARNALASGNIELIRRIAWAYCVRVSSGGASAEEKELLGNLVSHTDEFVAVNAIRGIAALAETDPTSALVTLLSADIGKSAKIADTFCEMFCQDKTLSVATLNRGQLAELLLKLSRCPTIDEHWTGEFIGKCSKIHPDLVIAFLISRVSTEKGDENPDYQALPYAWEERNQLLFHESEGFSLALRTVREWLLDAPKGLGKAFWAPRLYAAVSGGYGDAVISDLDEWANSSDPKEIKVVAQLLAEAPRDFIFKYSPFVIHLIEHAEALRQDCLDTVTSGLIRSAISGIKSGTPGEPFPEDLALRDKSNEMLSTLPRGSAPWRFFDELRLHSERNIAFDRHGDEDEIGY